MIFSALLFIVASMKGLHLNKQKRQELLIDDETLRTYVERYRTGGIKSLTDTHCKGKECRLSCEQRELLCEELEQSIYLTTRAVIDFVDQRFSTGYSPSGMRGRCLKFGLTAFVKSSPLNGIQTRS